MANDNRDPLIAVYVAITLAEETMDIAYVQKAKEKLLEIIADKYSEEEEK